MIAALLILLLQSGQPAPEAPADDRQWVCTASAKGKHDARVDVSIQLTTDRDILTRNIGWSPPTASRASISRPDVNVPGLTLYYEYAEADDIDEVTDALSDVSSVNAPAGTLDQMALAVRIDHGEPWYVRLERIGPPESDSDYRIVEAETGNPAFDFRTARLTDGDSSADIDPLESLQGARIATLSLVDRKENAVSRISYDLSATAERDRLFAKAWKKAEALALHPQRCAKTAEE